MKLPFDVATKLVLRVLLPGALLAMLFWPLILAATAALGISVADTVLIPTAILVFGWVILLLDMPIYMLAEGRRFWPDRLWRLGVEGEADRLVLLQARIAMLPPGDPRGTELSLEVRQFPIDAQGRPFAAYPTRLGNLLRAVETYPDRKYGLDGVFAWYRLWVAIDKDLRGELDDQQAIVDSALYAAVILALAVPVCAFYALLRARLGAGILPVLPSAGLLLAMAIAAGFLSWLLYRISLFGQAQYGELFAAVFDRHAATLNFDALLRDLAAQQGDPRILTAPPRDRNRAAVRFLKWHRYRRVGDAANVTVTGW